MRSAARVIAVLLLSGTLAAQSGPDDTLARAQVWLPGDVASRDIKTGPAAIDSFAQGETIECKHLDKKLSGMSPKFACEMANGDELKVKYGGGNGEVYAEVIATRLLWALGFGADRMYSVRVICRGCPRELGGILRENGDQIFDPAVVERKMPGREMTRDGEEGWSWKELDRAESAPVAHRDALKLLAVFMQHTDTKPQQQRLLCLDDRGDAPGKAKKEAPCTRPLMMLNDVGVTFGRANLTNANTKGSVNLKEWSTTAVWKDEPGCVGNLPKSLTGTLDDPVISEAGRAFLSNLLGQLTDVQLRDLFEVARVTLRPRDPKSGRSGFPSTMEWVDAFKSKRAQISDRRCA